MAKSINLINNHLVLINNHLCFIGVPSPILNVLTGMHFAQMKASITHHVPEEITHRFATPVQNETPVKCKGKNYKCIEEKKICDGIYDCPELEDEHNCTQCQRMYNLGKQKCLGENCMYIEKVMNKNVECWKNL